MPIKDLQQRFAQVGVIRFGEKRKTAGGKEYPAKLETIRFTSASKPLIEAVAAEYGGEVRPWQHQTGPQFEVITPVTEVAVFIPRQIIDPNLELWGNRYVARRCDGEVESIRKTPCLCAQGTNGHIHQFENSVCACGEVRACKPTTRLSLLLANREGQAMSVGSWKAEAHGWNAASELPMFAAAIARTIEPIPGRLELQMREKNVLVFKDGKEKVEPRKYGVPVLHVDVTTAQRAFTGELDAAAHAALGGAEQRAAIGSTAEPTVEPAMSVGQFKALADLAKDAGTVRSLWARAKKDGVLNDDLEAYLTAAAKKLGAPAKQAPPVEPGTTAAPTPVVPVEVIEAETEPDGKAVWQEILLLAHEHSWNRPAVEKRFTEHMGFDYRDDKATGWALAEFRDAVKNGAVA